MNQPISDVLVDRLTAYTTKDAIEIGLLHRYLSSSFIGEPAVRGTLETIISSPFHDQLVARTSDGKIVGVATLTTTIGSAVGKNAWLEDFVVDPNYQGMGIGSKLWDSLIAWCTEQKIHSLKFTSNSTRKEAHHFYVSRGAQIRDTNCFVKIIQK